MAPKPLFSHGLLQQYACYHPKAVVYIQCHELTTNIFFLQEASPWGIWWIWKCMLAENVGFNSLDLAKYVYTIMFYICIKLLLRLASLGHLSTQSFPQMVFLICSPSKPCIANLRHACCCVTRAILRMLTEEKAGLVWVLLSFSVFLCRWLLASGQVSLKPKWSCTLLYSPRIWHRFTHKTIHVFSIRHGVMFLNSGKVWKSGVLDTIVCMYQIPTDLTTTSGFCSTPSATTHTGTETFMSPSYTAAPSYTAIPYTATLS